MSAIVLQSHYNNFSVVSLSGVLFNVYLWSDGFVFRIRPASCLAAHSPTDQTNNQLKSNFNKCQLYINLPSTSLTLPDAYILTFLQYLDTFAIITKRQQ